MSNLNFDPKSNLSGKPQSPDFADFAKTVGAQKRAQFAYEFKNGLLAHQTPADSDAARVDKFLRQARLALLKQDRAAAEVYMRKAIELQPDRSELHSQLGDVLLKQPNRLNDALSAYLEALRLEPTNGFHCGNIGTILMKMHKYKAATEFFELSVQMEPKNFLALSRLMHVKGHQLDWRGWNKYAAQLKKFRDPRIIADPFAFLALCDDGAFQKQRSIALVENSLTRALTNKAKPAPRTEGQKIRIGYFSNDWFNHATMHLMAGLLNKHDRDKFEIYIYDTGSKMKDADHERARSAATVFRDVVSNSTLEIVDIARGDALDIAIDLKGFTDGGRLDVFNERVAPVQVAYLGYPGTTGCGAIDYMIADETTIPARLRKHYTEKILYMPHCYQPNDDQRYIQAIDNTKESFGLPEDAFVFASFNNPYKVTPSEYDVWMELLKEVPGSVLWFYTGSADIIDNLRAEAEKRGVDPDRIVPTGKMSPEQHLARIRYADLFLDTFNVNAHTTASDSLWAGVPLVTKLGDQFAARVAGSILKAVGLDELVTASVKQYKQAALKVARNPEYLADIKSRLNEARETSPLFDTEGYTKDYEALLEKALNRYLEEKAPTHMAL